MAANEAWIIDAVRSPRGSGKKDKGALSHLHPQKILGQVLSRYKQARTQIRLVTVLSNSQAVNRANIDTGIAFNTKIGGKHRLYVAIETPLHFLGR